MSNNAVQYFNSLNYTLANEDTRIEYRLLGDSVESVFAVAGSGSRVLPLIAKDPERIEICDLSIEQLYYCELKLAAIQALGYTEYLYFIGYRGSLYDLECSRTSAPERRELFSRFKGELSRDCRAFWEVSEPHWNPKGFIWLGRWERHFRKLSQVFQTVLRMNLAPVFDSHTLSEQKAMYRKHWHTLRFKAFLKIVANETVFNRTLYKGHFAGSKSKKTERRSPAQFLEQEFRRIFRTQPARESFFLQMLLLGTIRHEEGLPLEAHAEIFEAAKKSKTKVTYTQGNLLERIAAKPFQFYSLSDTVSYMPKNDQNQILQNLHPDAPAGAMVVIRSFLSSPEAIDHAGFESCDDFNRWALERDCTGVYQFHIYRKNGQEG